MQNGCDEAKFEKPSDTACGVSQDDMPKLQHTFLLQVPHNPHEHASMQLHTQRPWIHRPENRKNCCAQNRTEISKEQGKTEAESHS